MFDSFSFKIHIPKRLRRVPKALPAQSDSTLSEHRSIPLPTDVIEQIIDTIALLESISERSQALRNCALTCKSWLPRSQYNLFRRVRYHIPGTLQERKHVQRIITLPFQRRHKTVSPPGPSVFDALANVLDNAPCLKHLVREIEVLLPCDPHQSPEQWNGPKPWSSSHAGGLNLAPLERCSQLSLPALNTLRFVGFYRDAATLEIVDSARFHFIPTILFHTVTTLELHYIVINSCYVFEWIIASLGNLRNLECEHTHWGPPYGNFNTYHRIAVGPCTVSRLRLEGLNEYEVRIPSFSDVRIDEHLYRETPRDFTWSVTQVPCLPWLRLLSWTLLSTQPNYSAPRPVSPHLIFMTSISLRLNV